MATLVPVMDGSAVYQGEFSAEVWTHGQASLVPSCQTPQVHDETFSVWCPWLGDESRFVDYFHGGGNHQHVDHATTFSCILLLKHRCRVVSWSRLEQTHCRGHDVQDVREAFRAQYTKHRDSSDTAQALRRHSGQCALWQ